MNTIISHFSFLFILMTTIQIISGENATINSNEISIDNIKATASKLNPAVRSALLQAIDKLEKEVENDNSDEKGSTENPNFIPTIQFYTASAEDTSQEVSPDSDIILKTIFKNVASSKESVEDNSKRSRFSSSNSFQSKSNLLKSNNQQTRSISSDSSNEISDESKTAFVTPTTIRPKLNNIRHKITTTTTTTTTTEKPTHNEDGENIEVVEKKDIKIFKAPLVTAFSVQQDDKGTLKKVVPIYNDLSTSSTTIRPLAPLFSGGAIIEKLRVTATNVSNILLPTPVPTQSTITAASTIRPPSDEPQGIPIPSFLRSNSIISSNQLSTQPLEQQQKLFSSQQSPPLEPTFNNPQTNSINAFLLERQRFLEQQIIQLQIQARQQQEQILLQQRLLEEQRRAKEELNGLKSQVNPTKNIKTSFTVRPSLEIVPSNHLPDKNPVNFHPNFIPFNGNGNNNNNHLQHRTSFQIQPANQINLITPQTHFTPPLPSPSTSFISSPLELSTFQQPPQKAFQPFKSQQQINSPLPLPEHLQPRTRHFRQESGIGNFGVNSFFNAEQPNNRFSDFNRQRNGFNQQDNQSQNLVFQPGILTHNFEDFSVINKVLALNHGISPFAPTQNFQFPATGQFGGNF